MAFGRFRLNFGIRDRETENQSKRLHKIIERIRSLPLLRGRVRVSEVHAGDERLAILIPNIHSDPTIEEGDQNDLEQKAIDQQQAEIYDSLTEGKISNTVATEGRPFSSAPVHPDKKFRDEYGVENEENLGFSHVLVGFRSFVSAYLRNSEASDNLESALAKGKGAGNFLFDRYLESPIYGKILRNAPKAILSQIIEINNAVKKEVVDIADQLFPNAEAVTFENTQALLQGLNHLFDTHVAIRRNELIAENVVKIFTLNRRKPIIFKLGANHFSKDGGMSGIPLNTIQELLKKEGCSYIILLPETVAQYLDEYVDRGKEDEDIN